MRESNSHQRFWRPLSYHLTNPLFHWKHNDYRWQKSLCIYSTWKGYSQQKLLTKCIFCDKIFCVAKRIFSFDLHMNVCVAQLDRAFGYGPKGRGFESSRTRWNITRTRRKAWFFCYININPANTGRRTHFHTLLNTLAWRRRLYLEGMRISRRRWQSILAGRFLDA